MKKFEQVEVTSRQAWRDWLITNHKRGDSVWVVTFKKGRGPYVAYEDVVEEALCFGWIDSVRRRVDESRSKLLLSPRRSGSGWSKVNKDRIARLADQGQMSESGLALIAAAKADGSWAKLDAVDALLKPDDLAKALKQNDDAEVHFDAFPKSVRRGILEWITQAKRPETRAKRIDQTAAAAADNERVGQWGKRTAR